jgi:Polyketide cyclase / dehydrase and lipid transport
MRVEKSIVIDRPPEAVFGFLSVRSNDPVWMASVTESEWLDPAAPMGVGRRGRMVMDAMGRREFLDEVTEYEPGRRIAHRSVAGPMVIRTACIAEPVGNGCRDRLVRAGAPSRPGGGQADGTVDGQDRAPQLPS